MSDSVAPRRLTHAMVANDWLVSLASGYGPLTQLMGLSDFDVARLEVSSVARLQEQLTMLKAAVLTSDRVVVHQCPMFSDTPSGVGQASAIPFTLFELGLKLARSSGHAALPYAEEFNALVTSERVVTFERTLENVLRSDVERDLFEHRRDCVPLNHAVARSRLPGTDLKELLFSVGGPQSDDNPYPESSLITLISGWMIAHPNSSHPLLDDASSTGFGGALVGMRDTCAVNPAQEALRAASMYLTQVLPGLEYISVDEILEWRLVLDESLSEFAAHLEGWVETSAHLLHQADQGRFIASIEGQLDAQYMAVQKQAKDSRLWPTMNERLPVAAGATAAFALGTATAGGFQPVASLIGLGGISLGQAVTTVMSTVRKRRALRRGPLYWRYRLQQRRDDPGQSPRRRSR